jgi:hypothetical protein
VIDEGAGTPRVSGSAGVVEESDEIGGQARSKLADSEVHGRSRGKGHLAHHDVARRVHRRPPALDGVGFDAFKDAGPHRLGGEVMNETGAIVGGRGWYDAALANYDGGDGSTAAAGRVPCSSSAIVRSTRPTIHRRPSFPALTRRSRESAMPPEGRTLRSSGRTSRASAWTLGSSTRSSSTSAPVLLGDGVCFYATPPAPRVDLERTLLEESGRVIDLRYRVRR